jgi:phage shock protein C
MINQTPTRRLYRSRTNVVFAGVAGGIAEYFNIDPTIVRVLLFLMLLASTGPFSIIAYFILAVIIPQAPTIDRIPTSM